jgi:hypothetical protein
MQLNYGNALRELELCFKRVPWNSPSLKEKLAISRLIVEFNYHLSFTKLVQVQKARPMAAKVAFAGAHVDMCFQITTSKIPTKGPKMHKKQ